MQRTPEKSNSVPDVTALKSDSSIMTRNKRRRPNDINTSMLEDITKELKDEMKELFSRFALTQSEQINSVLTTLKDIQQTSNNVQSTITFLCEENSELKLKIEQLERQAKKDKENITILENEIEENRRGDRKVNIEIKNVPLKSEETKKDILERVLKLSETLNMKLDRSDVRDIIKVNKNKKEKSSIIVEFTNTFVKTDILKAAKTFNSKNSSNKLRAVHMGIKSNPDCPIYISENLTSKSARLYFLARDLKNLKNYKYCWTRYGKVYLRLDDNSPIISIISEAQIHQMANK